MDKESKIESVQEKTLAQINEELEAVEKEHKAIMDQLSSGNIPHTELGSRSDKGEGAQESEADFGAFQVKLEILNGKISALQAARDRQLAKSKELEEAV